ncbi:MAG: hypothetical protein WCP82_11460 [Alphaproteobacteria bacterium]
MHDLLHDLAITWGFTPSTDRVSFASHIAPIFRRLSGLQWVNQGFAETFGSGAPYDVERILPRLADWACLDKVDTNLGGFDVV